MSVEREDPAVQAGQPDKPIGDRLRDLSRDLSAMVERQIALARREAAGTARSAGRAGLLLAAGGALGLVGFVHLTTAAVEALARTMPRPAASGLVGLAFSAAGAAAVMSGLERIRTLSAPLQQTCEILREDRSWARDKGRDLARESRS